MIGFRLLDGFMSVKLILIREVFHHLASHVLLRFEYELLSFNVMS